MKRQKSKRQSRVQVETDDGIETVDDILRPLDSTSAKSENRDALARFQWVPLPPTPNAGTLGAVSVVPSGPSVVAAGQGESGIGVKSSTQFKKQQVSLIKKGLISLIPSKSARQTTKAGDS